ncbi:glycosyl transferase [Enemella dayhoffiae]|uniref:Glycosyl transferase n=2 Tax=Enemella dayhoffiae TaxID=2016507 RepID=A0A255H8R9_9ACTN|nr:glycosyl transferase [Enemella dayhoffiae]
MRQAIESLGTGYVAAGHERVLVVPGERDRTTETAHGILVEVDSPHLPNSAYRMIAQPWRALAALDRFRPTTVEVSDKWTLSPVAAWARRREIGSVLFSHERLDAMLGLWLRRQFGVETAVGALNRRLAQSFDAVVVTSQYAADEFHNTGANLVKVPLGVDLRTFTPGAGSPTDDGVLKLCYVGRLSREKSPHLAVAGAVELHRRGVPLRLDVYGEGPHKDELVAIAGNAPVFFHGYLSGRAAVAEAYAAADASLSVCPAETFGLAVLEALACGTPVVTSNRGGARELVDATCGEWGSPDAIGIADAIERMAARPAALTRRAARVRAEQYDWSRSVQRMLELHQRLGRAVPYRSLWRDRVRGRLASGDQGGQR